MVRVSFASLVIRSKITKSLQLALLWRAALAELKTKATLRTGDCPPLFEQDVLDMLSAVPDLTLVFYGQVRYKEVWYCTPATANLAIGHVASEHSWHLCLVQSFNIMFLGARTFN